MESRDEQSKAEGKGGEVPVRLPGSFVCAKAPFLHPYSGVIIWKMLLHMKKS